MNIFTKNEVRQMKGLDRPNPTLFRTPESMKHFLSRVSRHTFCAQPIRYGLQVAALIVFIAWGIFTGHWRPFFIFTVLTIVLRGFLLLSYVRLYRSLRKGPCHYRADKYGISLIVECENGEFVRSVTDSWSVVRRVYAYRDFIAVKMEKMSEGADEYLLFPDDMEAARNSILGFWQHALQNIRPEELPDFYTEKEIEEATAFIENNFGEIECIGHETVSDSLHIDLAIIKPADGRPYYTICTLGAGALRMEVPEEERYIRWVSEYNEYVIYLPTDWDLSDEGIRKEENWWPLRLLKSCARSITELDGYFGKNDLYVFNEPLDKSTSACAAYFDFPLPDPAFPLKIHLSTGRSVNFLQIIPLDKEEADYFDQQTDYADRYRRFFGIDLEAIEESTPEERSRIFEEKILEHFRKMIISTQQKE